MDFGIGTLIYVALAFGILGFLARDQLLLRLLMLGSTFNYLFYYGFVNDTPLWDPIFANLALGLANLTMICVIVIERSTIGMSSDEHAFYRRFPMMTPGQFRRLRRAARPVQGPAVLVRQGLPVRQLFYVHDGSVTVEKDGHRFTIGPDVFVGEVAFITGATASASVTVPETARVLGWTHDELDRLFRRMPSLRVALLAHLNADMARKVAASTPIERAAIAPPATDHA